MLISKSDLKKLNVPLLVLSYVCCFVYGLVGNGRGSIFPDLLRTFHLSDTEGSIFFSLASATGLAANVLTYRWYPRLGPVRSTAAFFALFALGTFAVSASPSFTWVLVGAALIGVAMGGSGLLANVLAVQSTSDSGLRRRALAGLHTAFGVASTIAPLFINALTSAGLDWRWIFAVLGLSPLAAAILALRTPANTSAGDWKSAFVENKPYRRAFWYASVCTLYVAVEVLLSTRLTLHAQRDLGLGAEAANVMLSVFFGLFFLGRLLFTLVRTSYSNASLLLVSSGASLVFFVVGLYVHPWGLAFCGLALSVFYPCAMAHLADELGPATTFAMSWCQTAQGAGTIVMHAVVGWLSDRFGLQTALLFGPASLAIVLLFLIAGLHRESPISLGRIGPK